MDFDCEDVYLIIVISFHIENIQFMTSNQPKRFYIIHQDMEYLIGTWEKAINPFTGK